MRTCKNCNNKGFTTQMRGVSGSGDFPGDKGYYEPPTIQKNKCRQCEREGPTIKDKIRAKIAAFLYYLNN